MSMLSFLLHLRGRQAVTDTHTYHPPPSPHPHQIYIMVKSKLELKLGTRNAIQNSCMSDMNPIT